MALPVTMRVRGPRFAFSLSEVHDPKKGEGFVEARPRPKSSVDYEGRWPREGSSLVLHVERMNGSEVAGPLELKGEWRGDEIVLRGTRAEGLFPDSVLWKHNQVHAWPKRLAGSPAAAVLMRAARRGWRGFFETACDFVRL
jgi:hypothetical protein